MKKLKVIIYLILELTIILFATNTFSTNTDNQAIGIRLKAKRQNDIYFTSSTPESAIQTFWEVKDVDNNKTSSTMASSESESDHYVTVHKSCPIKGNQYLKIEANIEIRYILNNATGKITEISSVGDPYITTQGQCVSCRWSGGSPSKTVSSDHVDVSVTGEAYIDVLASASPNLSVGLVDLRVREGQTKRYKTHVDTYHFTWSIQDLDFFANCLMRHWPPPFRRRRLKNARIHPSFRLTATTTSLLPPAEK